MPFFSRLRDFKTASQRRDGDTFCVRTSLCESQKRGYTALYIHIAIPQKRKVQLEHCMAMLNTVCLSTNTGGWAIKLKKDYGILSKSIINTEVFSSHLIPKGRTGWEVHNNKILFSQGRFDDEAIGQFESRLAQIHKQALKAFQIKPNPDTLITTVKQYRLKDDYEIDELTQCMVKPLVTHNAYTHEPISHWELMRHANEGNPLAQQKTKEISQALKSVPFLRIYGFDDIDIKREGDNIG